jgi:hypothetical protein
MDYALAAQTATSRRSKSIISERRRR